MLLHCGNGSGPKGVGAGMTPLTCPKCQSEMRQYERNRVLVDQCTGCGGLFLDRGELEALAAAETQWHQATAPGAPAAAAPPAPPREQRQYDERGYQQRGYDGRDQYGQRPHKKRKSFLSELFDD